MLLNVCRILLFVLFSISLLADEMSTIAPLASNSKLLDLDSGNQTIIVGERGHVLVEENSGTFKQVSVPTKTTLTAVTLYGDHAWAVGHDATIIHSSDSGTTWKLQLSIPELDRPFLDVLFFDKLHGIAIGAYGMFYRTTDGGNKWTEELHASVLPQEDIDYLETLKDDMDFYNEELSFILPHFNRVFLKDGNLFMAGEAGLLATSSDNGKSWKRKDIDYYGSFFDVALLEPDNILIAAGLRGNLFVKADSSDQDWQSLRTCATTSLNSIIPHKNGAYIVGNNGVLFHLSLANSEEVITSSQTNDCELAQGLTRLRTDLSDAILNGLVRGNILLSVTSTGLKSMEIN